MTTVRNIAAGVQSMTSNAFLVTGVDQDGPLAVDEEGIARHRPDAGRNVPNGGHRPPLVAGGFGSLDPDSETVNSLGVKWFERLRLSSSRKTASSVRPRGFPFR